MAVLLGPAALFADTIGFVQNNLVSDGAVSAAVTDPNLVNPWGIAFGPTTPFWVADNGTGLSTLYRGDGSIAPLVVTIPPPGGSPAGTVAAPTGMVFNSVAAGFMGDRFIFATEDGTIAGWQSGTAAAIRGGDPGAAVYKGLAQLGSNLYATDFANGRISVFDSGYVPITVPGAFVDPNLPAGFAPFNIAASGGALYVTYAMQDAAHKDDVPGPGAGFVDKFDANGNFLQRVVSGGDLNSPWGMAWAPAGFGDLGGALLIGNFGDGRINAFDPNTGAFIRSLTDAHGNPLVIDGLWSLDFGNGAQGFDRNKLYFTAGINGEDDGLFGSLQPTPEPATALLLAAGLAAGLLLRRGRAA